MNFGWDDTIKPAGLPTTPSRLADNNKKRRYDDRRTVGAHSPSAAGFSSSHHPHFTGVSKRARSSLTVHAASVPLRRRLETLDKEALLNLIDRLCSENPASESALSRLSPDITSQGALSVLNRIHQKTMEAMPLGDDNRSDYCYLRVKPHLQEFFRCLHDFLPGFIPIRENFATRTLEFLDGCTELLHTLPRWRSSLNNVLLYRAYEEISNQWAAFLKQVATDQPLSFGPDYHSRLEYHQQQSGGNMTSALDAVKETSPKELSFMAATTKPASQIDFARAF